MSVFRKIMKIINRDLDRVLSKDSQKDNYSKSISNNNLNKKAEQTEKRIDNIRKTIQSTKK